MPYRKFLQSKTIKNAPQSLIVHLLGTTQHELPVELTLRQAQCDTLLKTQCSTPQPKFKLWKLNGVLFVIDKKNSKWFDRSLTCFCGFFCKIGRKK